VMRNMRSLVEGYPVSSDPIGLARWAIVSENMELINLVLTVWVGGSILFSVVWLLSLE
jgi:hypothetical protein